MAQIFTLKFFFLSPNLVWFAMALTSHLLAPYDIAGAAAGLGPAGASSWLAFRFVLNYSIAFMCVGGPLARSGDS